MAHCCTLDERIAHAVAHSSYASRQDPEGEEQLARLAPPAYGDGASTPSGADRPNARAISNAVFDGPDTPNPDHLTDMFWVWGQFVDHDTDLTPDHEPAEPFPIAVPTGDPDFDPLSTGTVTIPVNRSVYETTDGVREQVNKITSFLDATNVYGSDPARAEWLRYGRGGLLRTSEGDLPPLNDGTQDNAVSAHGKAPYVVGDVRGNEQPLLLSLHVIWLREHNRWARLLAKAKPCLSDEQLYQRARVIVEALIQHITWNEFLPLLLGPDALPAYKGYKPETDTRIANEFSAAAYRLGHSLVSETLWRLQPNGCPSPYGHLPLKEAYFAPHRFANEGGPDPLLRGAAKHVCQKLDARVVSALRNFLFGPPGAGGLDLAAINIQRGRDHGLPDYNTVRTALGLAPKTTFAEISSTSAAALSSAYGGDVSKVDLFVGGLAEDPLPGAQLGETFHHIVRDQFVRLRDGDPYWHERRLSPNLLARIHRVRLADVIRNNTGIRGEISNTVMKNIGH